ncbi:MAG: DUF2249 domain-containing protein [Candidatus Schekmanbacteria bacterium]|nr:DUF2249 domain-containing protein [Candidatus Schekmanbacteria bacterium]
MPVTRELDVRTLPPFRRHPEIFALFDALKADEVFVLANDHSPKPLLYQFQAERPGRFDWSVLEAGPVRCRVEIRRRSSEGTRRATEYLGGDHRRLDAIVPEVRRLVSESFFPEASDRFAEFSCGLSRHIDAEEQALFPTFERATGMTAGGPTFVMRDEHVEIRRLMDQTQGALAAADATRAQAALNGLSATLATHNAKEEQILYPMTDQALGSDRACDDLVKRMQAI